MFDPEVGKSDHLEPGIYVLSTGDAIVVLDNRIHCLSKEQWRKAQIDLLVDGNAYL